jgi:hypothetical protein
MEIHMGTLIYRAMGAAVFDGGMYEGIERDRHATWQAAVVVLLSSIAAGIGAGGLRELQPSLLAGFAALALLTWIAWAGLILAVGGRHLRRPETRVDLGELLRTIGFAASPGLLQVFALIPAIAVPVYVVAWGWMLAATVVAVQHALDLRSLGRAVVVCAASLAVALLLSLAVILALTRPVS